MTPEEKANENKDTPEELSYGEQMAEQRKKFLNRGQVDVSAPNHPEVPPDDSDDSSARKRAPRAKRSKKSHIEAIGVEASAGTLESWRKDRMGSPELGERETSRGVQRKTIISQLVL